MPSGTGCAPLGGRCELMLDKDKLRICFLAGTLGRGGAERQLVYMLRALKGAGVSTRVLCLTEGEAFESEIKSLGVPVDCVGAFGWRPMRLYKIVRALREKPADILQSVHFYTNLYTAVAARILRIGGIGAIRNDLVSELNEKGSLSWGQLKAPGHLIANSAIAQQRAIGHGISPERIALVRNAVDAPCFKVEKRSEQGRAIRILFVGRLVEQKRPDRFLRAAARVIQKLPAQPIRFVVAGDGPLRSELEALALKLNLGRDQLEFTGELADVGAVYDQADLLVLTSDWEGTPNVLLEAMARSIPIVATRAGGVPEIIGQDRGLMVEPDDEDNLTAAIERLVVDSNLRLELGRNGQEYVARDHSLGALKMTLLSIYEKVLSS